MEPKFVIIILGFFCAVTIASLATAIVFSDKAAECNLNAAIAEKTGTVEAEKVPDPTEAPVASPVASPVYPETPSPTDKPTPSPTVSPTVGTPEWTVAQPPPGENPCKDKKAIFDFPNVDCVNTAMENVLPQAGGNVTKGYNGDMNVSFVPIMDEYWKHAMCPVNVHWHLGTEHYSLGEFDETGTGPDTERMLAEGEVRGGYRCKHYDANDPKFTTEYDWKYCVDMKVGETYEVHWPHSAAGACGTLNQYQTPFYDGVFCGLESVEQFLTVLPTAQDIANAVGVQGQVFTIVNDESYYYPDLMRGMIVDGEMGTDIAKYTGSTTGTSRDNEICSQYSPITWQVDRKCHLVSASSFDKMCADMLSQRDDMSDDLYAHGSRELVDDQYVANNHANRRGLRRAN